VATLAALRPGGKPIEVGRLAHPKTRLARTRAAWRARARREALAAQRWAIPLGIIVGSAFGAYVASRAGDLVGAGIGAVALAGCVAWPGLRFESHAAPLRAQETWKAAWDDAARRLRSGLDRDWTIFWDRQLPGWDDPVTIAVGPSGIWGIWIAPPGAANNPDGLAETLGAVFPEAYHGELRLQVRTHTAARNPNWWRKVVTEMVCADLSASPGDRRRWTERIGQTTLADPEAIRDV
jgi:hypothetical protein